MIFSFFVILVLSNNKGADIIIRKYIAVEKLILGSEKWINLQCQDNMDVIEKLLTND